MRRILIVILSFSIPLFLLLKSVEYNAFNKELYLKLYKQYGVLEVTGRSLEQLDSITEDIFGYLKDEKDETVMKPYFNEREILHMIDVKNLFQYGFMLKNIFILISVLALGMLLLGKKYRSLGKALFFGPLLWVGSMFIFLLLAMSNFNKYFTYFHEIFFDNDLWILNPETDLLIQMLPQDFFSSIFTNIILLFLTLLAILLTIGILLMRKGKDYDGGFIKL